jgi:hypothetical protein
MKEFRSFNREISSVISPTLTCIQITGGFPTIKEFETQQIRKEMQSKSKMKHEVVKTYTELQKAQ